MESASLPAASALAAIHLLRGRSHQAYLAGGCVRDGLLGLPTKDFDIATSATPAEVLSLFPGANLVGAHFGVVIVEPGVEVATFRSDHAYWDGRRPSGLTYETDPRRDAERRDFTINALFQDPDTGKILDFVGGRADLEAGILRAVGEPFARFQEDYLRLLRAVRFAARFNFRIEPATLAAMQQLGGLAASVAPERIRDEISRILTEGGARRGFEWMEETNILPAILPEVTRMRGVAQPPEFHPEGDVWTHTMIMLEGLPRPAPLTLALGVLLHDVGKPDTFRVAERIRFDGHVEAGVALARAILGRLRYPNDTLEQVEALIANHMRFGDAARMRESTLKRFLRLPGFDEHLALHRLDCLSSHRRLENYDFVQAKLSDLPAEALKPAPLLRGADLIEAGYRPGPRFSEILTAVEDAQLEESVKTPSEALIFVRKRFPVLHFG